MLSLELSHLQILLAGDVPTRRDIRVTEAE